jgi:hypothetical protein
VFAGKATADFVFIEDRACLPVSIQSHIQSKGSHNTIKVEDTRWVAQHERGTGHSQVCVHHYVTGEMNRIKARTSKEILPHYNGSI